MKLKNILKMRIEDETAAFTILGVMVVTFAMLIGFFELSQYNKTTEVGSNIKTSQIEQIEETKDNDLNGNTNVITEGKKKDKIDEEKLKKENEKEYEKLKEENKISSAADRYYIKVNYGAQVVNIYKINEAGEYKPYKAMVCSTGTYTPTSGVYRTLGKGNWWGLIGDVYGQYSTHIMGDILFHSVPYLKKGDRSSLEYWAYDQLGQRVSMGCVRLTVRDAKWIYDNCPIGTQVEFYASSNPGPFGKPTTRKISSAPNNIRGWDPTDPDSRNPWPKYLKELEEQGNEKDEEANCIVNDITNEVIDEPINDIVNDTIDIPINDVVNDTIDTTVNDIVNNTVDIPVNDIVNDITEENENDSNDSVINNVINEMIDDIYVNEMAS